MNAVITNNSNTNALISIAEIFGPTIQGEGALIGTQTVFVRTGGCDYRCSWCDTGYAVLSDFEDQWQSMTAPSIMEEIALLSNQKPLWVTLSGGNPAQQDLAELISLGQAKGYQFSMETQGSIAKSWFSSLDQITLSPKPPSTGMSFKNRGLERCLAVCENLQKIDKVSLKFVVADKKDLLWSKSIADQYPHLPCFVQPCNTSAKIEDCLSETSKDATKKAKAVLIDRQQQMLGLIDEIHTLNWNNARVLPQLHTWLWGDKKGV